MKTFYIYLVTNRSRVVLYTGVTNDLARRVWGHQHGEVKGFTKTYRVDRLVYCEVFPDPQSAIAREKQIKGWTGAKRNALVETLNPKWAGISRTLLDPLRGPSPSDAAEDDSISQRDSALEARCA
ncbi:MAG: GIY-YIG nuclease family protein [Chthoniobacterales bacterium]